MDTAFVTVGMMEARISGIHKRIDSIVRNQHQHRQEYEALRAAYVEFRDQQLNATKHLSDCALRNEPAYPARPCDCGRVYIAVGYRGADDGVSPLAGLSAPKTKGYTAGDVAEADGSSTMCLDPHPLVIGVHCQLDKSHYGPHSPHIGDGRSWINRVPENTEGN